MDILLKFRTRNLLRYIAGNYMQRKASSLLDSTGRKQALKVNLQLRAMPISAVVEGQLTGFISTVNR
ncbi:Protein of unknown function [Gryllus bimaculatus]|nr:Protein of unknown function [Gryllus bimaculatus]